MKLLDTLNKTNTIEKTSFFKMLSALITSDVLLNIWNGFKKTKHQVFPVNLLMRDALISDDKILKALKVK